VPFDFSAAGTSFATSAFAPLLDGAADEVDVVAEVELDEALLDEALLLLLLLPQAASAAVQSSASALSSGFLQVSI
jgi:hypothetical protein